MTEHARGKVGNAWHTFNATRPTKPKPRTYCPKCGKYLATDSKGKFCLTPGCDYEAEK